MLAILKTFAIIMATTSLSKVANLRTDTSLIKQWARVPSVKFSGAVICQRMGVSSLSRLASRDIAIVKMLKLRPKS